MASVRLNGSIIWIDTPAERCYNQPQTRGGSGITGDAPRHILDLTRRERIIVTALAGILLCALALRWAVRSKWWRDQPQVVQYQHDIDYRIDLNSASAAELRWLPDVGESRSHAIVKYRKRHGPFKSVDDLSRVHGINVDVVERIRPYICVPKPETGEQ